MGGGECGSSCFNSGQIDFSSFIRWYMGKIIVSMVSVGGGGLKFVFLDYKTEYWMNLGF